VLLQIVADSRNVRGNLDTVGEADSGNLPQSRVRLFRRHRVHTRADTPPGGVSLQRRRIALAPLFFPAMPYKLIDRWHATSSFHLFFVFWAKKLFSEKPFSLVFRIFAHLSFYSSRRSSSCDGAGSSEPEHTVDAFNRNILPPRFFFEVFYH
jgi:hypothetical protein